MTADFGFTLEATCGAARAGWVTTAHGAFETPAFMAVGTAATVKAMTPGMLQDAGCAIVLANTYHLMLRPGAERIEALGGLHRFMNWPGPILTDSGGFQVMSLAKLRTISEAGVAFQSHLDGAAHELTPEHAVEVQRALDADISMVLDECPPAEMSGDPLTESVERSMRWAERSKAAFDARVGYGLFGINQGGTDERLRANSAASLTAAGFHGYAIGGLAVGEGQAAMFRVLDAVVPALPAGAPRYLMGVGKPDDLIGAVMRGVDMFDCVLPTRSGRTGQAFTSRGTLNVRNARYGDDAGPLDPVCACPVCAGYSRAYLNHLNRADEILGAMLLTQHNLHYYQSLMNGMREAIEAGSLADYAAAFAEQQARGDVDAV